MHFAGNLGNIIALLLPAQLKAFPTPSLHAQGIGPVPVVAQRLCCLGGTVPASLLPQEEDMPAGLTCEWRPASLT